MNVNGFYALHFDEPNTMASVGWNTRKMVRAHFPTSSFAHDLILSMISSYESSQYHSETLSVCLSIVQSMQLTESVCAFVCVCDSHQISNSVECEFSALF